MARSLRNWAISAFLVGLFAPALPAQDSAFNGLRAFEPEVYDGIFYWSNAAFAGHYRKEPDGSLQRVEMTFNTASGSPAWAPVREVTPVPAALAIGTAPPAQASTVLGSFIPGGRVAGPSQLPVSKGKDLLVVFSPGSSVAFHAVSELQTQVGAWAELQKDAAVRAAADRLSRAPIKDRLTADIAKTVSRTFRHVTVADDLGALGAPGPEYALIFDVGFSHDVVRFLAGVTQQRNGRGSTTLPPLYTRRLSWILLDRDRNVIASAFQIGEPSVGYGDGASLFTELAQSASKEFSTNGLLSLQTALTNWPAASTPLSRPASAPKLPIQASDVPPLLRGEILVKTLSGCGVILDASDMTPSQREIYIEGVRRSEWFTTKTSGSCENGLATGTGWLQTPADRQKNIDDRKIYEAQKRAQAEADRQAAARGEIVFDQGLMFMDMNISSEFAYGRDMYKMGVEETDGMAGYFSYVLKGESISVPRATDPYAPVWGNAPTMLNSPGGTMVQTVKEMCDSSEKACLDKPYDIFGVRVTNKAAPTGVTTWCPNKRSSSGCQALWQEKAGPIIASLKAFVVAYEQETGRRKQEYSVLNTQWQSAREAAVKERAEIANLEFAARLERATTAGALFAIADEMSAAGKFAESRKALIALVTRFSSHPLGLAAAKRLAK